MAKENPTWTPSRLDSQFAGRTIRAIDDKTPEERAVLARLRRARKEDR
jgi:hypothetical protein